MPPEQKTVRKLKAILSADVKGYSLLMAVDEAYTIRKLEEYRTRMSNLIGANSGRVVDAVGDNLLAEFSSAVDAVQCAVEIQKALKEKNAEIQKDKRLNFRIGINIGDVVQDGARIYGSGVNIAARIEGLADVGGVCISRNVYEQIKDKLTLGYEYLGDHDVKNIKDPVRVYKVLMDPVNAGKLLGTKPARSKKKWSLATAVIAAIIVTSIVWYFVQITNKPEIEPASIEKMVYPLPEKPSIAVLPFDNMSGDPSQEYFCDGMAEEIITALSKVPQLFVIARNSSFSYKGKPVKVQQISEELGVRYVLEGSVRKSGDKIRITAQLIDALKGHHLWAERYDRQLNDIFSLNDEITKNIISALQVQLTEGEQTRLSAKGTNNLEAYLKYMEGHEYLYRFNKDANLLARKKAEEALSLDPKYAYAYALLGKTYLFDVWFNWSNSPKESFSHTFELANQAISLDEYNFEAHRLLSHVYLIQRKHDKAIEESEKAVSLAPSAADAVFTLGIVLRFSGRVKEAISMHEKAIRLNPIPPASYLYQLGLCYAFIGEYEKAIEVCKRALEKNPDDLVGRITLAIAYSALGRISKAEAEAAEVLRISPNFTIEYAAKTWPYKNQVDKDLVIDSLRKARLPDKPPLELPNKPSIAVLPFDNLSNDPEQEYFSDGLTDDIITTLSKCPRLFVIARDSVFSFKDKKVPFKKLSKDLGVRYLLEGSVRKSQTRLRISAQLIDAITEHTLWAERYEKPIGDIFAIQDEITLSILRALQVNLSEGDQARLIGRKTNSLDAYLKAIQAQEQFYQMNRQGYMRAKELAKESIDLDPRYALPYTILANAHMLDAWFKFSKSPGESMRLAASAAEKALSLDNLDPAIYSVMCNLYVMQRQYEKAITAAGKAIELSPGGARPHFSMGIALQFSCKFDEAIPYFEEAIRLNPYPPGIYFRGLASVYRFVGRYDESLIEYKKALNLNPGDLFSNLGLTSLYILMDRMEDAKHQAREVLRLYPNFSLEYFAKTLTLKDQSIINAMIENLRKAGLN
jgi:adenylate cyclase